MGFLMKKHLEEMGACLNNNDCLEAKRNNKRKNRDYVFGGKLQSGQIEFHESP